MPAKRPTILVVDDDPHLLRLLGRNLELEGYDVLQASNGEDALTQAEARQPDLILLDVAMPRLDGFAVLEHVRARSRVPVILLTASATDQEKVRGFALGADDYLTKPFRVEELLARLRAVLRRTEYAARVGGEGLQATQTIGDLTVKFSRNVVVRQGHEQVLSPIEQRLLACLVQHVGRPVTTEHLLARVWGEDHLGEHHMLHVTINRLRHKIEADPAHPRYLLTKPGFGYFIAAHPLDERVWPRREAG
jgi:DNA-binding response OmpR family regulator